MIVQFLKEPNEIDRDLSCISAIGRISRSTKTLKENLNELSLDKHLDFNDKWYKRSNHGSLGDLASIHLDISGISIIAAKVLEIARIGVGYCELSTRYVDFNSTDNIDDKYYIPNFRDFFGEGLGDELTQSYKNIMRNHFRAYEFFKTLYENSNETASTPFDSARYSLPAAAKVGLGIHCDIRALKNILINLRSYSVISSEIDELFWKLYMLLDSNLSICKTIDLPSIKYLNEDKLYQGFNHRLFWELRALFQNDLFGYPISDINGNKDFYNIELIMNLFFEKVLATSEYWKKGDGKIELYKYDDFEFTPLDQPIGLSSHSDDMRLFYHMNNCDIFHKEELYLPRFLESMNFSYNIQTDFGSFRDYSRHRMCSLLYSPFPISLGYRRADKEETGNKNIIHDSYYLSPIESSKLNLESKSDNELVGYNINLFQKTRYTMCEDIIKRSDSYKTLLFKYCFESLTYTQPLSAAINSTLHINLREAIKLVNQRTTKASHPAYKNLAHRIEQNIVENLNKTFK